eukprot:gene9025-10695_t
MGRATKYPGESEEEKRTRQRLATKKRVQKSRERQKERKLLQSQMAAGQATPADAAKAYSLAPKRGTGRLWDAAESDALRRGVCRYGVGKWQQILRDPELGPVLQVVSSHVTESDEGTPGRLLAVDGLLASRCAAALGKRDGGSGALCRGASPQSRSNVDLKDKWRCLVGRTPQTSQASSALVALAAGVTHVDEAGQPIGEDGVIEPIETKHAVLAAEGAAASSEAAEDRSKDLTVPGMTPQVSLEQLAICELSTKRAQQDVQMAETALRRAQSALSVAKQREEDARNLVKLCSDPSLLTTVVETTWALVTSVYIFYSHVAAEEEPASVVMVGESPAEPKAVVIAMPVMASQEIMGVSSASADVQAPAAPASTATSEALGDVTPPRPAHPESSDTSPMNKIAPVAGKSPGKLPWSLLDGAEDPTQGEHARTTGKRSRDVAESSIPSHLKTPPSVNLPKSPMMESSRRGCGTPCAGTLVSKPELDSPVANSPGIRAAEALLDLESQK